MSCIKPQNVKNIFICLLLLFIFSCAGNNSQEERASLKEVYNQNDPTNSYYQAPSAVQQYQQQYPQYQRPYQQQQYYQPQPYIPPTYSVPASRYYSNPYAIPPSNSYQRYDADQYYVPPNYYQNIERPIQKRAFENSGK